MSGMRPPLLAFLVVPLLLGAAAHFREPPRAEAGRFHLKLHAPAQGGIYFTAWADDQDVVSDKDGSDHQVVTYRRRYIWLDGCTWEGPRR
jgi:hypothetical protein